MLLYMNLRVTSNQKPLLPKKKKEKGIFHNSEDRYQITRKERKGRIMEQNYNQKTINKMVISTYVSIIALNVSG